MLSHEYFMVCRESKKLRNTGLEAQQSRIIERLLNAFKGGHVLFTGMSNFSERENVLQQDTIKYPYTTHYMLITVAARFKV
jgi:hypothetical protein